MKTRPIVFISALSFAEIILILLFPEKQGVILAAAAIFTAVLSFVLIKKRKYFLCAFFAAIIILAAATTLLKYSRHEKAAEKFIEEMQGDGDVVYTAVVDECKTYASFSQMFVTLISANDEDIGFSPKARLGCFTGEKLSENDIIEFSGDLQKLGSIEDDEFDTETYLRSKEIFIDFPFVSLTSSSPAEKTPFLARLRDYTSDILFRYIPKDYNYDTASVCFATFAGDRSLIQEDVKEGFTRSGLTHILCVSGMHLAILCGSIYFLLSFLSLHKKLRCLIIILVCIFYTAFTGFSLSTVRACIMCIMCYTAMLYGKKTDGFVSLFLSLLLICIISPYSALDVSLLLSFCATLGMLCMSEIAPKYNKSNTLLKLLGAAASLLYSNVGAAFFTLPVCAFFFKEASVMSVLSTLSVCFLVEILLTALLILLVLSPLRGILLGESLFFGLAGVCRGLTALIIGIAQHFASFKYALCEAVFSGLPTFIFLTLLLTAFIAFDIKQARQICLFGIILLGIVSSFINLSYAVCDDGQYKVVYYRKNEDNRQISIKLGKEGYLIVNSGNNLCTDESELPFDKFGGSNYLLILPGDNISEAILADNIRAFDERFGLKRIFIPLNEYGAILSRKLYEEGIEAYYFENNFTTRDFTVNCETNGLFYISIDDGTTKTGLLFGDGYDRSVFDGNCDICAYFTRKTKNQFDLSDDTPPECEVFFTRLKKGEGADGLVNTYGKKSVTIKG